MMTEGNGFTPVQRKMMDILRDGLPHTREELHGCLYDEMGPVSNIRHHLTGIRKILRPRGEDVITELVNRNTYHRWVRLLSSPYDGKR